MNVKFAVCTGVHCGSVVFVSACSLLEIMEMLRAVLPTQHHLQNFQKSEQPEPLLHVSISTFYFMDLIFLWKRWSLVLVNPWSKHKT